MKPSPPARPAADRPNIVYLQGHDIGQHAQPYGSAVDTPNMQRLAEQGVFFRQAHSASPICSPSRAALLTGQSPHNTGMLGLTHRGFELYYPEQHLATILAAGGYETVLVGFQHVTHGDPVTLGYTTVLERADFQAASVMRDAAAWLEQRASKTAQPPFFLDAGAFEVHRPFPNVPETAGRYVLPVPTLPDAPETRYDTARFECAIEHRRFDHMPSANRLEIAISEPGDLLQIDTVPLHTTEGTQLRHRCRFTWSGRGDTHARYCWYRGVHP